MPCVEAAGCWLVGPSHRADCRPPGYPGASAGSLVGGVKVQKTPGLLLTHWWVKLGPGVSAGLLTSRALSWSLAAGPRDTRAGVRSLVGGDWILTQLGLGSRVLSCYWAGLGPSWSQGRVWPAVGRLGLQAVG